MRPSFSYDPLDDDKPFKLMLGEESYQYQWLTRSELHALRQDLEAAEQLDRFHRMCSGDEHSFRLADAQPLLPPGEVAVQCKHCPANGALDLGGVFAPVVDVDGPTRSEVLG